MCIAAFLSSTWLEPENSDKLLTSQYEAYVFSLWDNPFARLVLSHFVVKLIMMMMMMMKSYYFPRF